MKKFLHITAFTAGLILLLFCAGIVAVQSPAVQTRMANAVVKKLQKNMDGRITFTRLHIKPFNALVLKDVVVTDNSPATAPDGSRIDTVFTADNIIATFSLKGLLDKGGLHIRRAFISNGSLSLAGDERGMNLQRMFGLKKNDRKKKKEPGNVFDIGRAELRDFHFRLLNYRKQERDRLNGKVPRGNAVDWTDLDVIADIKAHSISMSAGYMSGVADRIHVKEKSGLELQSISGKARVGHGKTAVRNLRITDATSDIFLPNFTMTYANTKSFKHFIEEVKLHGELGPSKVDLKTVSWFAPALSKMNPVLDITGGTVDGYINDLNIRNLTFKEKGSSVKASLSGSVTGLPDSQGMLTRFNIPSMSFTTDGLGDFLGSITGKEMKLGKIAPGEVFVFSGSGEGPLNRLKLNGNITSDIGNATAALDIRNLIDKNRNILIDGKISTDRLNLKPIAGSGILGECTLSTRATAVLAKGDPQITIDSLRIDKLNVNGYDYSQIAAAGKYSQNAFDGKVICNDPNLNFIFQGIFNFSPKSGNALYKFYANLGYADLNAINIDKRGTSRLSLRTNANYMIVDSGDAIGEIDVRDVSFVTADGRHDVGDITISSHSNDEVNRIRLSSSFAEGNYVGTASIGELLKDIITLTAREEFPVLFKDKGKPWNGNTCNATLRFHDSRDILSYAMPGLYIADSTTVRLSLDKEGIISAGVKSPRLAFKDKYLKNLSLTADNKTGDLSGNILSKEMKISGMTFLNSSLRFYGGQGNFGLGFNYDNETTPENKGEIYLRGNFERDDRDSLVIRAGTLPSNLYYEGDAWSIKPAEVVIRGGDISIDRLLAECSEQNISVTGGISKTKADTLSIRMNGFDISPIASTLKQDFGIEGRITGTAALASPLVGIPDLRVNLYSDSTKVGGKRLGRLELSSSWNDVTRRFDISAVNLLDGGNTIKAEGFIRPSDNNMDMLVTLSGLDAGCASPVLGSVFTDMGGRIWGNIRAQGPLDRLTLSSTDGRFDNVALTFDFTKVPYIVNGPFHITTDGLYIDNARMQDRVGGSGSLNGAVTFGGFKQLGVDIGIRMNSILALNTKDSDNPSFYGNVAASGMVSVKGPVNNLAVDIDAVTQKTGTFHIPLGKNASIRKSNLLTFKERETYVYIDPYEEMMSRTTKEKKAGNDLSVRLKIRVSPGVQGVIELDRELGNQLTCNGSGTIQIEVRPSRALFTIKGDYNPSSGNFHYNAMNLAQRDFSIQEGSSIRFNGDIMDSDLDVTAQYTTKTSLSTLLADTSAVATRRTVICGLNLTEKLRNPKLNFSISVPDLDPTTQAQVESALNTEDKVQKQFLSLLISNSFLPNEQSGIVNNSNMLYSNVAEVMAGQLNNILQKLDIPLDLGLNYQSNQMGTNIFDVALSTQLFNNRVIVNGTIGNRQYGTSGRNDDVVGDLDIDVKLNRQGNLRLNLFSHSADQYTNYLDNSQRNGVGVTYQRDFNRFGDFLRSVFTSRKKRERMMRERFQRDSLGTRQGIPYGDRRRAPSGDRRGIPYGEMNVIEIEK
ncbi:MAG: translocation/assembly module TamB domain-containing protein [Bacteroidales bacterium]|nr:translocation/assembly module TamB domain-containing protein [Bacteroidales bacterium]